MICGRKERHICLARFMLQFEELRLALTDYEEKLKQLGEALGIEKMNAEASDLEKQTEADGFWNDVENSQKVQQRITQLRNKIKSYENLSAEYDDSLVLIELADEAEDLDMLDECKAAVDAFVKKLEDMTLSTLLSGDIVPLDISACIFSPRRFVVSGNTSSSL